MKLTIDATVQSKHTLLYVDDNSNAVYFFVPTKNGNILEVITDKFSIINNKDRIFIKVNFNDVAEVIWQDANGKKCSSSYRLAKLHDKVAMVEIKGDEYFMREMNMVAQNATCDRGRSAAIFVLNGKVLSRGVVSAPNGFPTCDQVGHKLWKYIDENGNESEHCVRTVHAEQNAICEAAKMGIPLQGSTLYVRMTPCRVCAMMLIQIGVNRIVCERKYHAGAESEEMFKKAGIELVFLNEEIQKY